MEQGTIVEWLVREGDSVARGDILFQGEADKGVLEAESRYRGTLLKILVPADVEIPVLAPVAIIGEPGEDISGLLSELDAGGSAAPSAMAEENEDVAEGIRTPSAVSSLEDAVAGEPQTAERETTAGRRVFASPRARRLAAEQKLDLADVQGSGPGGRIVEADVREHLAALPPATPLARRLAASEGVLLSDLAAAGTRITADAVRAAASGAAGVLGPPAAPERLVSSATGGVIPLRGVRAIIAERMANSVHTAAAITLHSEVDATSFVAMRESLRDALKDELGFGVGYNDLLGVIVARCLVEYPYMNVQLTAEGIRQMPSVNVGLAVDSERGLLVPVVRNADALGIREFARTLRDLVERARQGRSSPDELSGGTFTITNLGMLGVDLFTPIINLPECAILGVGRIRSLPAVLDGQIVVRQKMWLSLTADHRLVDGGPAARFLQGIARYVEAPYLLLA